MIVVSDASPLNILVRVECIDILPRLFEHVVIPPGVARELTDPRTPRAIHTWMLTRPEWLEIRSPVRVLTAGSLGTGEIEAISLAQEAHADLMLVDDLDARRFAVRIG